MPFASEIRAGLITVASLGVANFLSCTSVLGLVLYHRYVKRKKILQSQNITLIIMLLTSDVIQSFGFMSSFRWIAANEFQPASKVCSAQGVFIQMGDLATAMFVILIALHTLKHFITPTNPRIPDMILRFTIAAVWILAFLSAIIPRIIRDDFYGPVGVWCWIQSKYVWPRLYLHYFYLFLAEAVSIFIYTGLGIYLWCYSSRAGSNELKRAARMMFMYPITYTVGTLPLAAARVQTMRGETISKAHLVACCIIFSSLGTLNCAVYVLTRRHLIMEPTAQQAERSFAEKSRTDTLKCNQGARSPVFLELDNSSCPEEIALQECTVDQKSVLFHEVKSADSLEA